MPALSEYTNVYNTALNVLDKKGFRTWYDDEVDMFCAEKDGWDFMAESPCALLGIVSIFEYKKPSSYSEYWWKLEEKKLFPDTKTEKPSYISVIEKK
ncbi:hypothetical protein [Superficieibacter sp. 1612_C1]|uniref:hypothetical protein n=1 Tax=Superficieibacter sp. 1612_C1 TaxID=2780382 RepID=UPI0018846418|nr:hypothetical protein [Superficieibacter sp. 1612_C1]